MLVSEERKFIFIHVYKNAGTSITRALKPHAVLKWQLMAYRLSKGLGLPSKYNPHPFPSHVTASELVDAMGQEAFDAYFSFAFVRNPWDWQVSLYKFMLKDPNHYQHHLVKELGNFDNYIRWRCAEEVCFQKDFIYGKDGELLVDFVGRFENIEADFEKICARLGISASLPRLNVSNTQPYHTFYTEETRALVRRVFDPDIALFGYKFEESAETEALQLTEST